MEGRVFFKGLIKACSGWSEDITELQLWKGLLPPSSATSWGQIPEHMNLWGVVKQTTASILLQIFSKELGEKQKKNDKNFCPQWIYTCKETAFTALSQVPKKRSLKDYLFDLDKIPLI